MIAQFRNRLARLIGRRPADMQVAALCLNEKTGEVLLVTSRGTGRWIVPKGWPMKGVKDRDAAAREAYEEAGVIGRVSEKPAGRYTYWKRMSDHFALCEVKLYLLEVEKQLDSWAEQHQRDLHWFKLADAADLVDEPELGTAIRKLETQLTLAA